MARTVQITIGASKTVNLGGYNSMQVKASIVVEPDELDDLVLVKRNAQLELRSLIEETWAAQKKEQHT